MIKILKRFFNSELISYGIAGLLTTLINIAIFGISIRFGVNYLIANTIAFIAAVLFAFIANDRVVFKVQKRDSGSVINRLIKFFILRTGSYLVDMFLMFILIDKLQQNDMLGKTITNVVVIVINYIMSKHVIFKGK